MKNGLKLETICAYSILASICDFERRGRLANILDNLYLQVILVTRQMQRISLKWKVTHEHTVLCDLSWLALEGCCVCYCVC